MSHIIHTVVYSYSYLFQCTMSSHVSPCSVHLYIYICIYTYVATYTDCSIYIRTYSIHICMRSLSSRWPSHVQLYCSHYLVFSLLHGSKFHLCCNTLCCHLLGFIYILPFLRPTIYTQLQGLQGQGQRTGHHCCHAWVHRALYILYVCQNSLAELIIIICTSVSRPVPKTI